ncbi:SIR2 family protein [Priestia aryabhattai]|uniref:SIR2 family NAD-dependent protein deacylase n=1 Tax=Priestia aryabhattai TaxID=412384 RepID=UPI003D2D874F
MEATLEKLFAVYEKEELIPFVGSGFSYPFEIPTWESLITELAKKVPPQFHPSIEYDISINDYWSAILNIKKYGNWDELELQEYVREIILEKQSTTKLDDEHNYCDLLSLNFNTFITTNYDNLLYENIKGGKDIPLNLHEWTGGSMGLKGTKERKRVWHLHGNLSNVGSIVLSKEKYDELYENEKYNNFFSVLEGNNSFLFLGFSFNDFYFKNLLKKYNDIFKVSHFILIDRPSQKQIIDLKEQYRLNVIPYDSTKNGHVSEIRNFLNKLKKN